MLLGTHATLPLTFLLIDNDLAKPCPTHLKGSMPAAALAPESLCLGSLSTRSPC